MEEQMYTVKLIQDSTLNGTLVGVLVGSGITVIGNYLIERLRIKAKKQDENNRLLIELKEKIADIPKSITEIDEDQIKLTLFRQITELMSFYQKVNHISKVKRTRLHISFMAYHRELLEIAKELDPNDPNFSFLGVITFKTASIVDIINKYIK
ncbi:hypothetical protein ADMFC3_11160 [Geovibrio sp. ADMFC3]